MTRLLLLVLLTLVIGAACAGSDDGDGATNAPTESATTAPSINTMPPPSDASPETLAREMIDRYEEMNARLAQLIQEVLTPEELAPKIAALRDEYIEVFVETGYRREAMSDEEVGSFNSAALAALNAAPFGHLDAVNELTSELNAAGENDLARVINSLNILTQYAQFELLWDQEPDEAERLALPSPAHPR